MKNLLSIVVFPLLCCGASAQTSGASFVDSGNAFLRDCSVMEKGDLTELVEPFQKMEAMGCLSFVGGFVASVEHERTFVKSKTKQDTASAFCLPEDVESIQMVRSLLKYIRDTPAEAHQSTAVLIMKSLGKAYPCPAK
jgi:Rap1a immunity proteins